MATWDAAFEANPPGTGRSPSFGDDDIRDFKVAVRERMAREHIMTTGSGTLANHGYHAQGSAVIYYTAGVPTLLPDGTSLGNDAKSKGRILYDPTKNSLKVWGGTSFLGVSKEVTRLSIQGTLAIGGAVVPPIAFTRTVGISRVLARVFSAPTGASLKMDIEKNGTLSIFKAGAILSIPIGSKFLLRTTGNFTNGYLSITPSSWLEFDIDQVGSTIPGSGLSVTIEVILK